VKTKAFKVGAKIKWNWMGREVTGKVREIYFKTVKKTFRGHLFRRNGSSAMPAYLVESSSGNKVLKLHSEIKLL
jgi:hypothetical protein